MKNTAGLVAIAALVGTVFACSAKDAGNGAPTDAGTPDTGGGTPGASRDASRDRNIGTDEDAGGGPGAAGGDASLLDDDTVGNVCATDVDCEKNANTGGIDDKFCSGSGGFTSGTLAPTPVCAGVCRFDTTRPTAIQDCDKSRGLCLQAQGAQGVCLPACEWEEGSAVQGCQGKNKCEVYGYGRTAAPANKPVGVGICLGGCTADADCTVAGEKCQISSGLCIKATEHKPIQDSTAPGTPCSGRTNPTPACQCAAPATGPGLCVRACTTAANGNVGTGPGQCATGTICTADLPKTTAQGALFTQQPVGIQGSCRKTCNPAGAAGGDTECAGTLAGSGYCDVNDVVVDGTTVRGLCSPGPRPAAGG